MPEMISLRSFLLSTTKGHCVQFEAKVPMFVPDMIVQDAMAAGCMPTDADDVPFFEDMARTTVEFEGDARRSTIYLAVKSIAEENDAKNFDGGGVPRHEVISERLGYAVSRDEVRSIYQQYQGAKSDGREFGLHPQAQNIIRVIEATSKGELIELAVEFGVDEKRAKPLNMKELRRLLLVKFNGNTAN